MKTPDPGHSLFEPALNLSWQTLRLTSRVTKGGWVGRDKSSAWRGMFGHALRSLRIEWYYQVFENKVSPMHPMGRRMRQGPVPYVMYVPDDQRTAVVPGDEVEVYLTLVGQAAALALQLKPVFERMGRAWGPDEARAEWAGFEVMPPLSWARLERLPFSGAASVRLVTPYIGHKSTAPDWADLVVAMAERTAWLSHFFCEGPLREDLTPWRAAAELGSINRSWAMADEVKRYSTRQARKMEITGWLCGWEIEDLHPGLAPLLLCAARLGVGKGAPWGMGRLRVDWLPA